MTYKMSQPKYNVENIVIKLKTGGEQSTDFKRTMLKTDAMADLADLSEYPFMTYDMLIPEMVEQMSFREKLNFFFNRFRFIEVMNGYVPQSIEPYSRKPSIIDIGKSGTALGKSGAALGKSGTALGKSGAALGKSGAALGKSGAASGEAALDKKEQIDALNEIVRHNILVLLKSLFPCHYPSKYNVMTSYDRVISKTTTIEMRISDFLPGNKPDQVFLELGGKEYTIDTVTWLNDVFNNTEYKVLVANMKKLNIVKVTKYAEINKNLESLMSTLKKIEIDNGGIETIKKALAELSATKTLSSLGYQRKPPPTPPNPKDYVKIELGEDIDSGTFEVNKQKTQSIDTERQINIVRTIKRMYDKLTEIKTKIEADITKDQLQLLIKDVDQLKTDYATIGTTNTALDKINGLKTRIDEISKDMSILKYINPENVGIDMAYQTETDVIQNHLKTKFPDYANFAEKVTEFIYPKKQNTNVYLQTIFDKFKNAPNDTVPEDDPMFKVEKGTTYANLFSLLMDGSKIGKVPNECMMLGITIAGGETVPRLSIDVQIDLINGKITDPKKIDCSYKDNYLGTMLEKLVRPSGSLMPWEIGLPTIWDAPQQPQTQPQTQPQPQQKGGGKTRRYIRWAKKTRRNHSTI